MKRNLIAVPLILSLAGFTATAQIGTLPVIDFGQEWNSLQQLGNDLTKIANQHQSLLNDIQKLAKLDTEILRQTAILQQVTFAATHFDSIAKNNWTAAGNMAVSNWTTPNYYGSTTGWSAAVNTGSGSQPAWLAATAQMQRGLYVALDPLSASRNLAYSASVNTFDGAGPVALQTVGNARAQQIQIDGAISRLQTAAIDGADLMNSQTQQLNLITAAAIIQARQQQTNATLMTSLLEQQAIANKLQRDQVADQMNQVNQYQNRLVSQPTAWGGAAQSISGYRMAQ